jgi:hypothetical protein
MATKTAEQTLIDLETKYWQAMKDKDAETAMQLTDDACILVGSQGAGTVDRQTFGPMFTSDAWTLEDVELVGEPEVRMLSDDLGIIAYKVREELTVDGKNVTLDAADASTWARRDGKWVCVLHTESVLGDPFGRDRKANG